MMSRNYQPLPRNQDLWSLRRRNAVPGDRGDTDPSVDQRDREILVVVVAHYKRGTQRADLLVAYADEEGPGRTFGNLEPGLPAHQPHPAHMFVVVHFHPCVGGKHDTRSVPPHPDLILP